MSRANPSTAKPPAHHTKMLQDCIAKGWIIRVGDSYEITLKGHERTMRLTEELAKTEQPYQESYAEYCARVAGPGRPPPRWS